MSWIWEYLVERNGVMMLVAGWLDREIVGRHCLEDCPLLLEQEVSSNCVLKYVLLNVVVVLRSLY